MKMLRREEILKFTEELISKTSNHTYKNKLISLHDFAEYFSMTKINEEKILSSAGIEEFMNNPIIDLNPLSYLKIGNIKIIQKRLNEF